jgi:DNA-binding NarL/FixJ family response regulator
VRPYVLAVAATCGVSCSQMSSPHVGEHMVETKRPPIRVVLADDAYLLREAVKHLLSDQPAIVVVGECEDARAVRELIDEQRANVLITDIRMPPSGEDEGIRLAMALRRSHPALGVIVLSTYAEVTYALKLFEDGADSRAYLLKDRIRDRARSSCMRSRPSPTVGSSSIPPSSRTSSTSTAAPAAQP